MVDVVVGVLVAVGAGLVFGGVVDVVVVAVGVVIGAAGWLVSALSC